MHVGTINTLSLLTIDYPNDCYRLLRGVYATIQRMSRGFVATENYYSESARKLIANFGGVSYLQRIRCGPRMGMESPCDKHRNTLKR
jgi:hypothetical protein